MIASSKKPPDSMKRQGKKPKRKRSKRGENEMSMSATGSRKDVVEALNGWLTDMDDNRMDFLIDVRKIHTGKWRATAHVFFRK
jgi:hypothetical protein